ncbi:MAG: tRNA (adenosine(37)-N6)-dimethylallyltransferase MiaA [Candidatus Eremiobacteraeota bacterium]|nr:tRNA (adenosine(37)-N6)-dimethylallyltransferase MiaA [Candidatus Eremiobacteraeota bacterium]
MPNRIGVLILAGPTASGKSELAIALAERFGAEIVGADSRQVYRDMPVGTAAPSAATRARVTHHLVGFLDPRERYSAARFAADALAAIDAIAARGRPVIVVGGTGFYVRALCGEVALSAAYDPVLRARLAREARLHPPETLHEWLAARDPERAAQIAPGDRYRVARALEIALAPAHRALRSDDAAGRSLRTSGIPFLKIVLDIDDERLLARIEARVEAMLAGGLLDEAERVGAGAAAADAVGYPQALAYLAGLSTLEELRASLVRATRRYAKRQKTWFRGEPGVRFVTAGDALERLSEWAHAELGWERAPAGAERTGRAAG